MDSDSGAMAALCAAAIWALASGVWHTVYTGLVIFLDVWAMSLVSKFQSQHRGEDRIWAILIFVFLVLTTIHSAYRMLYWWCGSPSQEDETAAGLGYVRCVITVPFSLIGVAVDVVFLVRVVTWLREFQSAGDASMDAAGCIMYLVLRSIAFLQWTVATIAMISVIFAALFTHAPSGRPQGSSAV